LKPAHVHAAGCFPIGEEMSDKKKGDGRFLCTVAMCIAVALFGMIGCAKAQSTAAIQLPIEGDMPSFGGAIEWLNSQPLTAKGLRGKVVLVDFFDVFLHQLAAHPSLSSCLG
jgi:hypothetical protein